MPRFAGILLLLQLAVAPLSAQEFSGQVGRIDEALLGLDWYLLGAGEFPILPVEEVWVSVLDCEPDCPYPVRADPDGRFRFSDLASPARLRFDPLECPDNDWECEPLEPREVERASGARTALGAKWPAGIEDTMLRYMPSVAGVLYIKRAGEIPGLPGAAGSASPEAVWVNGIKGWHPFLEYYAFNHELMHVYEFRLRRACWYENQEVNGYVLHENWLRAYDADRALIESLGLPFTEPAGYDFSGENRGLETLALFASDYFMPDDVVLWWRGERIQSPALTHAELEQYAPHRYNFFEKIVFERYLKEKSWLGSASTGEKWPGMCEPPERLAWALDRLPPLPQFSKQAGDGHKVPAGFQCGLIDLY